MLRLQLAAPSRSHIAGRVGLRYLAAFPNHYRPGALLEKSAKRPIRPTGYAPKPRPRKVDQRSECIERFVNRPDATNVVSDIGGGATQ